MRKWLRRWLGIEDLSVAVVNDGLLISKVDGNLTLIYKTIGEFLIRVNGIDTKVDARMKISAAVNDTARMNIEDTREVQKNISGEIAALSNKVDSRHADSVAMYEATKQNVQGVKESLAKTSQTGHERYPDVHARFSTIGADIERIKAEQSAHLSALSVILPRSNEIAAADTREQCAILIETIALPHFRESHRAMLAKLIREPLCR